ncbi:tripartite tricarboxylate transporter substrate binding protein [Ideonella azotifigens]|uniref:Tripartite tricarboxylate transporter substrate binding protein n=1 Tax=Ideonella azotifigens TaxID=513160 RepID=A0ABN1KGM5_9BURK|nr:tripartite tricarboxylate transporter substrate binding protein [Ideonella azotifigens]MCD2340344.1 tripartite tricarboxylate transporter substrate binding protein [Ideonella azotifigens]
MTKFNRRRAVLATLALAAGTAVRAAEAWPSKPIHLIVGYSAGGAVDTIARALAAQLQRELGQPVIVENKPGAGTNLAIKSLIDSPPDGHGLMLAANALAANVTLFQPAPYALDKVQAVSLVGRVPVVIAANAQGGVDSIKTLISQSKAKPDSIDYGSPGNGSTPHLAMELFERAAGIRLSHVPYKGGAQAVTDVIGGHIQTVALNALEVLPHAKAGKLKVLAVLSTQRSAIFPEAPTIAESGFPGFEASVWYGLVAPVGLPPAAATRLHQAVQHALAQAEVRDRLTSAGGDVAPGSTAMFAELLGSEQQRYGKLIREAHIQPE